MSIRTQNVPESKHFSTGKIYSSEFLKNLVSIALSLVPHNIWYKAYVKRYLLTKYASTHNLFSDRLSIPVPFYIIIDDVGLPRIQGVDVALDVYRSIVDLAKHHRVKLGFGLVAKYIDFSHVTPYSEPVPYAQELVKLIKNNLDYLEPVHHGLFHDKEPFYGEYLCIDPHTRQVQEISPHEQELYFKYSWKIYRETGIPEPEIFVPPKHLWKPGVTEKKAKKYGIKYLVTRPKAVIPYPIGPRNRDIWVVSRGAPIPDLVNIPRTLLVRVFKIRLWKELLAVHHSIMMHVSNFLLRNLCQRWYALYEKAMKSQYVFLAKNNEEAFRNWLVHRLCLDCKLKAGFKNGMLELETIDQSFLRKYVGEYLRFFVKTHMSVEVQGGEEILCRKELEYNVVDIKFPLRRKKIVLSVRP
ncbi:MAG: hypothetical protein DRJ59_05985 [Thermoprotei archaeon]|nr:MAG: hypothetical protein DRJ59_05985 [Thermoprotei archaeon]